MNYHPEDIALVEGLDANTRKQLAFIAERIRRRSYSPDDVRMRLMGLKVPERIVQAFVMAAANRKPEKPVYPHFRPTPIPKPEKPKPEKYAKIAFTLVPEYDNEGRPWHSYWGGWLDNRQFVKSFSGKDIEFTRDEKEAYKFTDDHTCDACMAKLIIDYKAWTIAIWEKGSQMVHYPGEHWADNDYLIPSFINRDGVNAFQAEGIVFDRRRGWHKKGE